MKICSRVGARSCTAASPRFCATALPIRLRPSRKRWRHALPHNVVEDVAARTGGVPLFVEEVTRLLLERGEGGGGIEAIPATLQQSLMARLDRLGPAREVAQIGSVIGRGFSYALIRDVAGIEVAALQAALEKLAEADIVSTISLAPLDRGQVQEMVAELSARTADSLLELTRQHGISVYATLGTMCSGWARAQLGDREAGVAEFREALATYTGQGNKGHVPLHQGLLAELEADGQDMEAALTRMDAALALAGETGEHWTDSFLHRVRGEILLKRNPAKHRASRRSAPHRYRHRATTEGQELRTARGAVACQSLSIDRPRRRRPRRPRARARRLFADAGISRDRTGADPARCAC